MINDKLKKKALNLVKKASENGLIKTYGEFYETEEAKEYALLEEDVGYYVSRCKKTDC